MVLKTSLDRFTKLTTVLACCIVMVVVLVQFMLYKSGAAQQMPMPLTILMVLGFVSFWLFAPQGYEVTGEDLVIVRMARNKVIARTQVQRVERVEENNMRGTMRLFGAGGFFGYFGTFTNTRYGRMTYYATRRSNYVLVTLVSGRKLILTPDDPDALVAAFPFC